MATKFIRNKHSFHVQAYDDGDPAEAAYLARELEHASNEDITPEGGGSAFAHLTEDVVNSQLVADWPFSVGDPNGPAGTEYGSLYIDGTLGPTLNLGKVGNNGSFWYDDATSAFVADSSLGFGDPAHPFLQIDATDGSLHLSDGAGAPDTSAKRAGAGILSLSKLGVENSAAGSTPGTCVKKVQIYDGSGTSLGYVAVYDAIT